jgi:chromosome segregation ATPase
MRTPQEILAKHGYPMPGDDVNLVKAMEEYKNQFIDFDGPLAMVDHYSRLARNWEDAHAMLEEKLRIQYDAEFEAFKTSFENRIRDEYEQKLNEAAHADASEITSLRKELEEYKISLGKMTNLMIDRDEQIERLRTRYNDMETRWMAAQAKYSNKLESDINDGKNSSHEHSDGKGGWSV